MSLQKPNTVTMYTPIEYAGQVRGKAEDLLFTEAKLKRVLKVKDRQQALSRFKWNLDEGGSDLEINFTPNMLEGMLYDKYIIGAGEIEDGVLDIFVPAWSESLDRYGRMQGMKPMFATSVDKNGDVELRAFDKHFTVVYKPRRGGLQAHRDEFGAVCYDYSPSISNTSGEPRNALQAKVIEEMADLYNYSTINLVNSLGIAKYNLFDEAQKDSVELELKAMYSDLKRGKWYQLTSSVQEIQDLTRPIAYNGQDYWQSYNSLNNERLGFLGLVNSGTFNKKERKLVDEANVESANSELVLENSLRERQTFCDTINYIYGTNFSVEVNAEEREEGFYDEYEIPEVETSVSESRSIQ